MQQSILDFGFGEREQREESNMGAPKASLSLKHRQAKLESGSLKKLRPVLMGLWSKDALWRTLYGVLVSSLLAAPPQALVVQSRGLRPPMSSCPPSHLVGKDSGTLFDKIGIFKEV